MASHYKWILKEAFIWNRNLKFSKLIGKKKIYISDHNSKTSLIVDEKDLDWTDIISNIRINCWNSQFFLSILKIDNIHIMYLKNCITFNNGPKFVIFFQTIIVKAGFPQLKIFGRIIPERFSPFSPMRPK